MALIRPSTGTADVQDLPGGLSIVIPAPRHVFAMLFLPVWLVGWAFGEVSAVTELFGSGGQQPVGFLAIWLVAWTLGGGAALLFCLWMFAGKQVVRLSQGQLSVRWEIFGLGFGREYSVSDITNLRIAAGGDFNPFSMLRAGDMWGFSGGPLVFDYGAHTIRFGLGLHEAEARILLPRIARLLPRGSAG